MPSDGHNQIKKPSKELHETRFTMNSRFFRLSVSIVITAVFLLSAVAKVQDFTGTVQIFQALFGFESLLLGQGMAWGVILGELVLAGLIWWRIPKIVLAVPIVFIVIVLYAAVMGLDCGCFGSLSLLRNLPTTAHVLLNLGLFAGMYWLRLDKLSTLGHSAVSPRGAVLALTMIIAPLVFTALISGRSQVNSVESAGDVVDFSQVQAAIDRGNFVLIDARADFQYRFGHIPGAINIPFDAENLSELIAEHKLRDRSLIVYCSSSECPAAAKLIVRLRDLGCKSVRLYPGGWDEWLEKEGEVAFPE